MRAARYAYYIIKGILSTFSLHGSMVGSYEKHSDPWMGYIFASRLEAYGTCLASERKSDYYRKLLLERAYPRPEYRIDRQPALNLIQLFFYVWAQVPPSCMKVSLNPKKNKKEENNDLRALAT
ncbi:hypothetical protein HPB47_019498 [Ixodes persulcatus]|uniref:Uncharacterized protein n=1 Tax=Ixodes persulcatus TaxID=34615 RepID=A0AC60QI43_IXOPE|nr:hypothetical protein HPB47_019498 [Ixodes persulcatus]